MADGDVATAPVVVAETDTTPETSTEPAAAAAVDPEDLKMPERVPKPDQAGRDAKLDEIASKIQAIKDKKDKARAKLDKLRNGQQGFQDERKALRDVLAVIRSERDALQKERQGLLEIVVGHRDAQQKMRNESKKLRSELKFTSLEDLDNEIKRLEMKQSTTSMGLKEEKELIKSIETLKMKRGDVKKYNAHLAKASGGKGEIEDVKTKLDLKKAQLNEVRDRFSAQMDKLKAVEAKFGNQNEQWDEYKKERDALSKEIDVLIKERNTIRAQWKVEHDAWYKYTQEVRRIKQIRYKAEEKARQAEYEAEKKLREEEEAKKKPWEEEIALCDYLVGYLEKLSGSKANGTSAAATTKKSADTSAFGGMKAIGKKSRNDDDNYMRMGAGKKFRKRNKKKESKIVHSMDMIKSFSMLSLDPPLSKSSIESSIADLKAKRDYYDVLPRDALKKKDDGSKAGSSKKATKSNGSTPSGPDFPVLEGSKPSDGDNTGAADWGKNSPSVTPAQAPVAVPAPVAVDAE